MRQAVNLVLDLTGMLIVIQIVLDFLRDRRELRIDRAEDSYFLLLLTDNLLLLGLSGMIQLLSGRTQPAARAGLLLCLFVHDTVPCFMLRRYYRFAVCRLEKTERLAPLRECVFWLFPLLGVLFLIINLAYPLFYSVSEQGQIVGGDYGWAFMLLAMANLACIDIAIMRIRPADNSRTTRHSRGVLLFLPVLTGLAILIRPLVYQLSIVWLTSALGMLHLHFDRQNEKILTDPLTMIGNRRACEGYMLRHLSRPPREDRQMFVCLIDVDQFKAINDQYGHDMGDHALRQTADILLQLSQPGDFVGRIGGDEFVVAGERGLLWDTDYARLQVNQAVERFNREGGMPYRLGLTCGFSCVRPGEEFSMDALLRQADLRMYSARGVTLQTVKAEENL